MSDGNGLLSQLEQMRDSDRERPQRPRGAVPQLVQVSSVTMTPVQWLWPGRIALGKVTLIAGDPGLGKSQLTAYLSAHVTTGGSWPANEDVAPVGNVIMLSAEDDIADTIKPRLLAAGANEDRVRVLTAVREGNQDRGFNLARDLEALEIALKQIGDVKLVTIDPITAYLGRTDTHKTSEVRAVFAPLADLAAKYGVAIIAVSHLSKSGSGDAINRVTGSMAFVAASRGAYLVLKDPENDKRRLLLKLKNNIGVDNLGLAFSIVEKTLSSTIKAPAIEWEPGYVTITANEAMAAVNAQECEYGALGDAGEFLRGELQAGPVAAGKLIRNAELNGIVKRTLDRAKRQLGIKVRKRGMDGGWFWELPSAEERQAGQGLATFEDCQENPKIATSESLATFDDLGNLRDGEEEVEL
jgi:putative DNA primase/helicase